MYGLIAIVMNKRSEDTPCYVVEFPLKVEIWQAHIIDKRLELLRRIYNYAQRKLLDQYNYMARMRSYKDCKTKKQRADFLKEYKFSLPIDGDTQELNFSKFGINSWLSKLCKNRLSAEKRYKDFGINSSHCEAVGLQLWQSWEKFLFDFDCKKVSFCRKGEFSSFAVRTKNGRLNGIGFDFEKLMFKLNINGCLGKNAQYLCLPLKYNSSHEYEAHALHGGLESIRVARLVRRLVRGKSKYYLQLTIEGVPFSKGRVLGEGRVGIDLGPSKVAVASANSVGLLQLASKVDFQEREIRVLQRKIDRSRRATNPEHFNSDGTIKKCFKRWNKSNRYIVLKKRLCELKRKQAAVRKAEHVALANHLLSSGDDFIIENNSVKGWTANARTAKKNERTGRFVSKHRFGKTVGNHAPSTFVTILQNKVQSLGGSFTKVDCKNAATQFDFTNGMFVKHDLKARSITLSDGVTHQRDMLSAFNLQHLDLTSEQLKEYDIESMKKDYDHFIELEQNAIKKGVVLAPAVANCPIEGIDCEFLQERKTQKRTARQRALRKFFSTDEQQTSSFYGYYSG